MAAVCGGSMFHSSGVKAGVPIQQNQPNGTLIIFKKKSDDCNTDVQFVCKKYRKQKMEKLYNFFLCVL